MSDLIKFEATGDYCELLGSHDGYARLKISLSRENNRGKLQRYEITLNLARSSVYCVHQALATFATKEVQEALNVKRLFKEE